MTRSKNTSVFSSFFHYVSLNVLAMLGTSCYILADTFFIANGIGEEGLTALNLVLPLFNILNATGLMIGIGGATKYAIHQAKGEQEAGNAVFFHAFLLTLLASVLFVATGICFTEPICRWLGSDATTHTDMVIYLRTLYCFAPLFLLNQLFAAFVRNDGAPNRVMAATMLGTLSNIVLDYVLIFPFNMGMLGAVLATACAPLLGILMQLFYFRKSSCQLRLQPCCVQMRFLKPIFLLGGSEWITEVASGIVIFCFNFVILREAGNTGVAAYGIIANIAMVAACLCTGIAQGVQPLLSHSYGRGEMQQVRKLLCLTLGTALGFAVILYGVLFGFTESIVGLFNTGGNVILERMAESGIRIYFLAFFFAGCNIAASAFFSAVERPLFSFCISLLRSGVILLPVLFAFAAVWHMNGIWASYPVAELGTCLVAVLLLGLFWRRVAADSESAGRFGQGFPKKSEN
ncbi:MAG: MATE family efflux transporter [Ruminococcus callidus]|nr:MATE family efflux transporter [Ruminococcus callidus]